MPPQYAAQLAALRLVERTTAQRPVIEVGDLVEVTVSGPWEGLIGEVELVGAVRCQVRVGDDLVSLPAEGVRLVEEPAARSGTFG